MLDTTGYLERLEAARGEAPPSAQLLFSGGGTSSDGGA